MAKTFVILASEMADFNNRGYGIINMIGLVFFIKLLTVLSAYPLIDGCSKKTSGAVTKLAQYLAQIN